MTELSGGGSDAQQQQPPGAPAVPQEASHVHPPGYPDAHPVDLSSPRPHDAIDSYARDRRSADQYKQHNGIDAPGQSAIRLSVARLQLPPTRFHFSLCLCVFVFFLFSLTPVDVSLSIRGANGAYSIWFENDAQGVIHFSACD